MKTNIMVLAEHKDSEIDNITWELVGKGRALADRLQTFLSVLLVGANIDSMAETLKDSGVDAVLMVKDESLNNYHSEMYTHVISNAIKACNPELVLMGYTYMGMEVGSAVAVRTGGTMVSNCTELDIESDKLVAVRSVFGGTLQSKVCFEGPLPHFVSFEKGSLAREKAVSRNADIEVMPVDLATLQLRSKIVEILIAQKGKIDITKSKIIVAAGRGIGGPDKIPLLQKLADALGGDLACSRPVADMGWLPAAQQVGISANYVAPDVYIACGISGASQHVTAMRDSTMIIAINKDPNAPIFRVADFGIVGDLFDVVPHFIEVAKKEAA